MQDIWDIFCGASDCLKVNGKPCSTDWISAARPSSCINHALIIFSDVILLFSFLFTLFPKSSLKYTNIPVRFSRFSRLQLTSAIFNGFLGVMYLSLFIWVFEDQMKKTRSALPLHWWLMTLFHGIAWLSVSLTASLRGKRISRIPLRLLSTLAFVFTGFFAGMSLIGAILDKEVTIKIVLDVLSFVGACLLLLCTYKGLQHEERYKNDLYAPLNGADSGISRSDSVSFVTPFAKAGVLNKMSFWWMNPLMKKGKQKALGDEEIPKLRESDRAESCYLMFLDILNKQKQVDPSSQPSILKTIVLCHWKELIVSGLFALLKITTLSAGPLLLNAFIKIAEGDAAFKNEGLLLAILLFISKNLESLSQRQWYFRSRLIGLKVRSLLTAAIYKKQMRLSNAAKLMHSNGEIMNYVTVDAYRVGEFPFWLHQTWTTMLQICFALIILLRTVGLATIASLVVIILTVLCNAPLAKLQHKFQSKLMVAQDDRLKAISEALVNMKVLKLYAWEAHFKKVIENLRQVEENCYSAVQLSNGYNSFLYGSSPVLVSAATFGACYFLGIPLHASNIFTFVATLRLVQSPVSDISDLIGVVIKAKVSFARIVKFLEATELENANVRQKHNFGSTDHAILLKSANISWEENPPRPTLRNINLEVRSGQKIAICGEVGSGKSTLMAAILGEVPSIQGTVQVYGKIAYVSQSAWIQTGTIQENILFGSPLDSQRYQQTLEKCSLLKDLELLPYGDLTEIGERGVNLSGGQKQRIQLARTVRTGFLPEYVMGALSGKTVFLVTHQVDFLPAFDMVLLLSEGEISHAAPYHQLLASTEEFQDLVDAHKETAGSEKVAEVTSLRRESHTRELRKTDTGKNSIAPGGDQLIKLEEREVGDTGFKPYVQYLNQNKGYLFFAMAVLSHITFAVGQVTQNFWMAANVDNPQVGTLRLIGVYLLIGVVSMLFLLSRSLSTVFMGLQSSKSLFSQLLYSLFRAPMAFYDSTPLGRILSRVSSDLSIVDLDIPFNLIFTFGSTTNFYSNLTVVAIVTWPVLVISIPMLYLAIQLQKYYYASAKELMRINGTTKSFVANHLAESIAGAVTIRAFKEEDRFFMKTLKLIDINASPFFHNFAANEWLIQRLETITAIVLASSTLCMVLLPPGTLSSGFIGMALSYGLSLNTSLVFSIQNQCRLTNYIISVERLNQYMHIPSEPPEIVEENRPPVNWPTRGKVEIQDLLVRYREDTPFVLRGISCTIEGGQKIGIVGRTGSGKTTLIGALFRLVEPTGGRIIVDGIDISKIGLHDLRSRFGIIPQDPTLVNGAVRYNLDPLSQHTDEEIWEQRRFSDLLLSFSSSMEKVLGKCQLREAVEEKEKGLDSLVVEDGSNWSMGQRQLFCLGRALLRKIAHRIPTVMDCTMVLAISDGKLVEYDEPMKLMKQESSLFGQLVKEYWSHYHLAESH
uniref:ABC-type xenobiotic transporter n=1 Tax=Solanum tuberosum TaxID=4113 RepID=M1A887_SOLTU